MLVCCARKVAVNRARQPAFMAPHLQAWPCAIRLDESGRDNVAAGEARGELQLGGEVGRHHGPCNRHGRLCR
eukprot:9724542-Lingulodinium_polyedra.AAC.1